MEPVGRVSDVRSGTWISVDDPMGATREDVRHGAALSNTRPGKASCAEARLHAVRGALPILVGRTGRDALPLVFNGCDERSVGPINDVQRDVRHNGRAVLMSGQIRLAMEEEPTHGDEITMRQAICKDGSEGPRRFRR